MQEEVKHYKVKSLPTQLRPNSVYYVKATSQSAVNTYITDQNGFPFPLLDLTGGGNVGVIQSVTGTGVTGTFSNPIINISTFKSSDSGNLIEISSNDGKLFVKPITSPDGSIDIVSTASALELQLGVSLQTQIQNALQPGDNVSELINDAGYITLADIPFSAVSATTWTPNHTTATGNPYLAGTIVYYLGHVFQANFNNDSITPAIGGNLYWTDLGLGYLIDQEQTDWLAVSGSEFIKNKPTNVSSFTNDAGYLTQDNVVEYPDLASFPVTGVIGTIYIAIDTGLFYSWNGTTYVPSSAPITGITGVGITNYVGRWTSPTTIGTGIIRDDGSNVGINTAPNASYRLNVSGNANISNFLYANVIVPVTSIIYDGAGNLGSRTRGGINVDYFAKGTSLSPGNITFSDGNYLTPGTETARFDTFNQRLGIRTTSPTEALDVNGNIRNRGFYYDETNSAGTAGKILSATSTGTQWINSPTGTVTGSGTTDYLPKWTSSTALGDSPHSTTSQVLIVNNSGRNFLDFGTVRLSVQRAQSQIDFNCGNPDISEVSSIWSDNSVGLELKSKGTLSLKTGTSYLEGINIATTGKLKFTQTPDTGATSDFLLMRDTSGNVKQIAGNTYVTTANLTLQNAYNNSTDGKIILDATRGDVKVKSIAGITKAMSFFDPLDNEVLTFHSESTGANIKRISANNNGFYVDSGSNIGGHNLTITDIYATGNIVLSNNKTLISYLTLAASHYFKGISGVKWESDVKIEYAADYSASYSNRSLIDKGYADTTYVPKTRTLTINGTSYDLSADRTWTIAAGTTSVTATSPITSSGGATPDISTSMSTNKLIGRSTAGTGVMEEITIGTGLTLSGGTLNATTTGDSIYHGTASGTDTYTVTISGPTAYNDGDAYLIRFTNGNTTGATLNINGLGAVPLYRNNDGPLLGGDVLDGGEMLCIYNSTLNEFQVIGISPNSLIAYVTNDDSVTITKGQAVYAFSGTGDRMTVKLANNVGDTTSAQTMGLVLSTSIGPNQKGFIITQGLLDGLNILPTATYSDGDAVYLAATAGGITNIKPHAPNHLVYLGIVTTASNGSSGRMYVKVQNGYELDELHNVQAQTPSLKDTLWYDNTVTPAQWKTASIPTILGYTPEAASTRRNANNSTNNNINYCGVASGIGVSESATVWTIKRLTIGASGSINIATATNVAWINRETETYI